MSTPPEMLQIAGRTMLRTEASALWPKTGIFAFASMRPGAQDVTMIGIVAPDHAFIRAAVGQGLRLENRRR